jgi:nitroreductase
MDIFEVMGNCRAIRYLKPDPIPQELVEKLVWAATRAPSPGNSQGWDFVLVDDRARLRRIGDAIAAVMGPAIDAMPRPNRDLARILDGAKHLATHIGEAPLVVFVCGAVIYPPHAPDERFVWSACYPAAQNLILAARALGLGATLTTFHMVAEPTVREVLEIPVEVRIAATIPVGWPAAKFGPVRRRPLGEVIHRNGWRTGP